MMEYFRRALIELKRRDNKDPESNKFRITLGVIAIISLTIGILLDTLLPFNFILNGIRGFFAMSTALSSYALAYLISVDYSTKKRSEDRYYLMVRKRFSHRQRVNISIVTGAFVTVFVAFATRENFTFTMLSSFLIFTAVTLIAFVRRNRSEFIKDIYEIPDVRDVEFMTRDKNEEVEHEDSDDESLK